MIGFSSEFDQGAAPVRENRRKGDRQGVYQLWRPGSMPVFGHKDNMQPKRNHRMGGGRHFVIIHPSLMAIIINARGCFHAQWLEVSPVFRKRARANVAPLDRLPTGYL